MTGLYRKILIATAHSLIFGASLAVASPDRGEGPGSGEVTAVSLAPSAGKAEVVISVRGAVDVRDFVLASPDRLVLDVVGAKLSDAAPAVYDGVKRGGVLNLRYSQFRPDVVRIVIDLDSAKTYEVIASGGVDQDRLRLRQGLPGLVVGRGPRRAGRREAGQGAGRGPGRR